MEVSLTPVLERWVSQQVDGVRYSSTSEVIGEALQLLQKREKEHAAQPQVLRAIQPPHESENITVEQARTAWEEVRARRAAQANAGITPDSEQNPRE